MFDMNKKINKKINKNKNTNNIYRLTTISFLQFWIQSYFSLMNAFSYSAVLFNNLIFRFIVDRFAIFRFFNFFFKRKKFAIRLRAFLMFLFWLSFFSDFRLSSKSLSRSTLSRRLDNVFFVRKNYLIRLNKIKNNETYHIFISLKKTSWKRLNDCMINDTLYEWNVHCLFSLFLIRKNERCSTRDYF
jgi:hypothetical protein